jgi:hypothetical protein
VFTKFSPNVNNHTTGNWLTTWDWQILPTLDFTSPKPVPPKGVDQEEYDETVARFSSETAKILVTLDKYKNMYIPNILGYDDPNTFSPELRGYNWSQLERQAIYTLSAKWFLYLSVSLSLINLWALGYFSTLVPEENPRSLTNRINDKYLATKGQNLKKKDAKGFFCLTIGYIVCMSALAYLYATSAQNEAFFGEASLELTNLNTKSSKDIRSAEKKIKEINLRKVSIEAALHRGEVMNLQNHMKEMLTHEKALKDKSEKFIKVVIGENP